jgi:hypothetical protein
MIKTQEGIKDLKSHVNSSVRCSSMMIWLLQEREEMHDELSKEYDKLMEKDIEICKDFSAIENRALVLHDLETAPGLSILIDLYRRCPENSDVRRILGEMLDARKDVEKMDEKYVYYIRK